MNKLRIVSDGTPKGTHVYSRAASGEEAEMEGVSCIQFLPFEATSELLRVKITFIQPIVDVLAATDCRDSLSDAEEHF